MESRYYCRDSNLILGSFGAIVFKVCHFLNWRLRVNPFTPVILQPLQVNTTIAILCNLRQQDFRLACMIPR